MMGHNQNDNRGQSANLGFNPLYYQFGSNSPFLGMGMQQPLPAFTSPFAAAPSANIQHMDWNPGTMLDNLTFIEEKIRQVKDVIRTMVDNGGCHPGELAQRQHVVNADLTCLIVQLISTAGSLLPSLKNSSFLSHPAAGHTGMANHVGSSSALAPSATISEENKEEICSPEDYDELFNGLINGTMEEGIETDNVLVDEQDTKDGDEVADALIDGDNMPPGSYELLQLERDEILAPHTHFCSICGKGFKRDANLRMHMRGHGDEYKSPAALAKPPRDASAEHAMVKRYSCPFVGCKRNKLHKNFQPLKTILCVKNHYKRSHCEKSYTCSRCHAKKFSVMADLKTHEKHCGREKWLCSCGTSFSRKDKLFAHVGLFQGHTPALPSEEPLPLKVSADQPGGSGSHQEPGKPELASFMWGNNSSGDDSALDIKGLSTACNSDFLPTVNFGSFNLSFGPVDEFTG